MLISKSAVLIAVTASLLASCASPDASPPKPGGGPPAAQPQHARDAAESRLQEGKPSGRELAEMSGFFPQSWTVSTRASGEYVFGDDLDGLGGALDAASAELGLQARGPAWLGAIVDLGAFYEYRHYDFDTDAADPFFGGSDEPFDELQSAGLSLGLLQALNDRWGLFLRASVQASAEYGAPLEDGISWAFVGGAGYRFSNSFILGVGAVLISPLEEDLRAFPGLQLFWQIDEGWRLLVLGNEGRLQWSPRDDLDLSLGIKPTGRRYRLDDDLGKAIFSDQRIPVFLRLNYRPSDAVELSLEGGFDVYRRIDIEDRDGNSIRDFDGSGGGFIGAAINVRF